MNIDFIPASIQTLIVILVCVAFYAGFTEWIKRFVRGRVEKKYNLTKNDRRNGASSGEIALAELLGQNKILLEHMTLTLDKIELHISGIQTKLDRNLESLIDVLAKTVTEKHEL